MFLSIICNYQSISYIYLLITCFYQLHMPIKHMNITITYNQIYIIINYMNLSNI